MMGDVMQRTAGLRCPRRPLQLDLAYVAARVHRRFLRPA